ncbi:MAG: DEAD/DEAH box helicase [Spirochaetales bacterium]|nr:DEAD/DEAH box helicase [Spirochaetales bacterium]
MPQSQKDESPFSRFFLSPALIRAVNTLGFDAPTPVQRQTIPPALEKRDILATAQTGTGKTVSYLLPLLEMLSRQGKVRSNHIRALILVPTRELASQIYDVLVQLSRYLKLTSTVVHGGVKINPQMMRLIRGRDILVATPGRLLDLYSKNAVQFNQMEYLVLDEADRMLNLGFRDEVQEILSLIPRERQTLMFTATFSDELRDMASALVRHPVEISIAQQDSPAELIEQKVYPVSRNRKSALFLKMMHDELWTQVLVFAKTKNRVDHLARKIEKTGFTVGVIHGDKSQGARMKALAEFKAGRINVLVATDLASRGLDINGLPLVLNYDMPHLKEDYIHRIGRTGRAGASGKALSFVCLEEFQKLKDVERLIQQVIPREVVEGFQEDEVLPPTKLDLRPFKPKKPKKNKKKQ